MACLWFLSAGTLPTVRAATIVWANVGTTFSTGSNWVGSVAPANSIVTDIGSFQAVSVTANPNLTASRSINGLEFTSGTAGWTFTGSGGTRILTLGTGGIVSNASTTQTFNNAGLGIALGAATTFTSNSTGALSFGSSLASFVNGGFLLTLSGTSTNANNLIAEAISGTGGLTKTGSGTWTLSGANTYSGTTNIGTTGGADGGTLVLGANHVLPGTTVSIFGGTLDINTRTDTIGALNLGGGAAGTTANITGTTGTLTLGGNLTYNATNNADGATISGNLNLGGAGRTFTVNDSSAAATDLTISGNVSAANRNLIVTGAGNTLISGNIATGTGGLTKQGTGTLTLSGTNTYTGVTTFAAGTVSVSTIGNGGVAGNLGHAANPANRLVFSGGTLQYTGATASTNRSFTLTGGSSGTINVTNAAQSSGASTTTHLSGAPHPQRPQSPHRRHQCRYGRGRLRRHAGLWCEQRVGDRYSQCLRRHPGHQHPHRHHRRAQSGRRRHRRPTSPAPPAPSRSAAISPITPPTTPMAPRSPATSTSAVPTGLSRSTTARPPPPISPSAAT
ncbi:MAG: autotransporter-associated beta strand repeat-containing protein [Opitutaceae bacterium]|nr:autotransporter-associated beta strand repeat-containing protein [Opitutaceae bacterium]